MPLHVRVHADVDIDVPEVLLEMQAFDVADLHALILHAGVAGLDAAGAIEGDGDRRATGGELLEREPGDDGEGSDRDGPDSSRASGCAAPWPAVVRERRARWWARGRVRVRAARPGRAGSLDAAVRVTQVQTASAWRREGRAAVMPQVRRVPQGIRCHCAAAFPQSAAPQRKSLDARFRGHDHGAAHEGKGSAARIMSAPWHCPTSAAGRIVWRRSWSARSPPERPEPPSRHAR